MAFAVAGPSLPGWTLPGGFMPATAGSAYGTLEDLTAVIEDDTQDLQLEPPTLTTERVVCQDWVRIKLSSSDSDFTRISS